MDSLLTKAGSFVFARRAKQELSSIGDDVGNLSTSVEEGAKRLYNKLKGKMQKPLAEFLQSFGLPKGIFPKNTTHYEWDEENKKITVYIPSVCEVGYKDSSVVRFATKVTGNLAIGKFSNIEGMKTKVLVWVKVTSITVDNPNSNSKKVCFTAGVKKSRAWDAYEVQRDGVEVDVF